MTVALRASLARLRRPALTLATAALLACSPPEPPQITAQSAQVIGVSPSAVQLRLVLDAYNPNSITLDVRSLQAQVSVADRFDLGTVELPATTSLPAKAHTPVSADMKLPLQNAAELAKLALEQPTVPYRIVGRARVGGEKLNVEVPFQQQGSFTRAQLLQLGLQALPALPLPMP